MHFSIPSVIEEREPKALANAVLGRKAAAAAKGGVYTCYVVHINGLPHCVVRYRQFHALHEQLRKEIFGVSSSVLSSPTNGASCYPPLPTLPSKKLLPLNPVQVEERRSQLEKYLQSLAQDPRISNSTTFNGFLLGAQRETRRNNKDVSSSCSSPSNETLTVDVYLMNDQKISVISDSILETEEVTERVGKQLGIPDEYVHYFALFFVSRNTDSENPGDFIVHRKIQNFESPYITQSLAGGRSNNQAKLVLRRNYWDDTIDQDLLSNKSTLNVLYLQTVAEIEAGWIQATSDVKRQLNRLQACGSKREYMELARSCKFYGYVRFSPCISDYPTVGTPAHIFIGKRELVMKIRTPKGEIKEGSFRVTKMRCWRVMTLTKTSPDELRAHEDLLTPRRSQNGGGEGSGLNGNDKLELSFEYLMNNQDLRWVTLVGSQAILMSVCLQSIVEELLRIRSRIPIKSANEPSCEVEYVYPKRDGSYERIKIRNGLHSRAQCPEMSVPKIDRGTFASLTGRPYSVKKLSESFSTVNYRQAEKAAEDVLFENEAFTDVNEASDGSSDTSEHLQLKTIHNGGRE